MSIIPTPTHPETPVPQLKAFLASLAQYPDGPSVTSAPVSFTDRFQKRDWIKDFPKMVWEECFTYSQSFLEKPKDNTKNRIALLVRPAKNWVGDTTWISDPWHAMGIAWIKAPDAKYGKDLVVFDVEGLFPDEVRKWEISAMPLIAGYVTYCAQPQAKRINRIFYWQDKRFRSQERCLEHTLEWLKDLTLIGDKKLSVLDWESLGFSQIGLH